MWTVCNCAGLCQVLQQTVHKGMDISCGRYNTALGRRVGARRQNNNCTFGACHPMVSISPSANVQIHVKANSHLSTLWWGEEESTRSGLNVGTIHIRRQNSYKSFYEPSKKLTVAIFWVFQREKSPHSGQYRIWLRHLQVVKSGLYGTLLYVVELFDEAVVAVEQNWLSGWLAGIFWLGRV